MKSKVIWLSFCLLLVAAMLLAACSTSSTAPTTTTSTTPTPTTTTTNTITTTQATTTATTATTTTASGNWWSQLGTPQYGGTMTLRVNRDVVNFDPYFSLGLGINYAWMENLTADDWTLNPTVFDYKISFRPVEYVKGQLAASWEFTDPSTYVVHLRHGIHWQNISPANGREFIAADVVYHFDREYGLGGGFTKPSPFAATASLYKALTSVTATDNYTVVFKWSTSNPELITGTIDGFGADQFMENSDAVKQWGDVTDWHHAIGTGPFILQDFVSGSSASMIKNPDYWGYDERYPQNQLPYVDALKILIIPDDATALAAMRTGKIDVMSQMSLQNAQSMQKTNPEILQIAVPLGQAYTVDPRVDVAPFKDIRVREAMQMAVDLPTIAQSYYGGTADPSPASMTSMFMKGYGFPYSQWPQDLKDQYAYNPTAAKQLLAAAGYPNGFKTDVVADTAADSNLLQIVKSYFSAIGIDMDIRPMDSPSWISFVRTGRKYDAMAYGSSGDLGFTYEPIRQLNRYVTNYPANFNMVSDPVFDAFAPQATADTNMNDIKQVLTNANKYVAQQHWVVALLQPNLFELCQPWLHGYTGQNDAVFGGTVGAGLLYFYPARFWIDQNLKKSLGH